MSQTLYVKELKTIKTLSSISLLTMVRQDVSVIRKVKKYLLQNLCFVVKVTEGYYCGLGGNEISLIIFAFPKKLPTQAFNSGSL